MEEHSRLTNSYTGQNFQNDFQPVSARLVVLRTVFKNLFHGRERRSRFF